MTDCPCKAAARKYGTFEGPVGDDWWECTCSEKGPSMSNHIGKSICANPIEWALVISLVLVLIVSWISVLSNKPEPICVVEATPVQQ